MSKAENQDEEDTDTKLALLASLLEPLTFPFERLLESLNDADGDVGKAAEELLLPRSNSKSTGKRKAGNSLQSWLKKPKQEGTSDSIKVDYEVVDGEDVESNAGPSVQPTKSPNPNPDRETDLLSIFRGPTSTSTAPSKSKTTPQPALLLTTQQAIDTHNLPITLLESPLPPSLASALYLELMEESEKSWYNNEFYLAGKAVKSPHTVQMYKYPLTGEKGGAWEKGIRYWYSGTSMVDIADYPPLLRKAADLVERAVNDSLSKRKRYPLEWAGEWKANCCGTNRYDGAKSSVGWHADQLTYLGPYTTIASLSLGTPRAFRLRQTNTVDPTFSTNTKPIRTYELKLGHNSLCLMNAGCQERYKHTVPPQKALDLFRPTFDRDENPIPLYEQKTYTSRINITFRFYREDFHPDPSTGPLGARDGTPICKCGIPTLLRADQKAKARSRLAAPAPNSPTKPCKTPRSERDDMIEDDMVYFWQCQSPSQTGDMKGCGFFKILDMAREGRGPCVKDVRG
ncbi:hypothetical protein I302_101968 [Kwoniella bestiolae CBS 10118]|uniref:Fe2OG dioxygenase domain-containing protein n=1 Tax=Kwoniella bestiolae CBS 10118 TaxID=1296100 RepID=A0A1B9GDS2_9TREE|nr:hypothetical protein I302_00651 [Kwoniella bestiolae CBS 10118]OCF29156.1 hypothetical protein I302_00651 [Kwoniella bestiolae CBS 10118]